MEQPLAVRSHCHRLLERMLADWPWRTQDSGWHQFLLSARLH
jgi:hypothetical protein